MADSPVTAPTPTTPTTPNPAPSVPAVPQPAPSLAAVAGKPAPAAVAPGAEAPAPSPEALARVKSWSDATEPDARKAAWAALEADEKTAAWKDMKPEDAKALGIEDPAIPVYAEFKMPDDFKANPESLKPAIELFKEMRLPQEQAQKLVDLALSRERANAHAAWQAFVDRQETWVKEVKADPEIGGAKFDASLAALARAKDRLAVPGLDEALNVTGAGDNPAVIKAFVRMGQLLSEDRFAPGQTPAPANQRAPSEVIYAGGPKQSFDAT